jgi:hypothetical protein
MSFQMRKGLLAAFVFLVVCSFALYAWFAPERTARRSFDSLLLAVSKKNWERVTKKIAPEYSDAWHDTREEAVAAASELSRHFFVLHLTAREAKWSFSSDRNARVEAFLHMEGSGTAIAQTIMDHVNTWPMPTTFTFRREGAWPGKWLLERVEQPSLVLETF